MQSESKGQEAMNFLERACPKIPPNAYKPFTM
jgi:hypothetical protein